MCLLVGLQPDDQNGGEQYHRAAVRETNAHTPSGQHFRRCAVPGRHTRPLAGRG